MLVVDDNATNRRILDEILTNWGMRPTAVDGGAAALEAMERAQARAGGRSRWSCSTARCRRWTASRWPSGSGAAPDLAGATIMMLSSVGSGDAVRCRDLGVAAYLSKPVRQSVLLDTILAVLARPASGAAASTLVTRHSLRESRRAVHGVPAQRNPGDPLVMDGLAGGELGAVAPPAPSPRPLRLVVAEDNRVNQLVIRRLLERMGHAVVVCDDGRAAVAAIERERPDRRADGRPDAGDGRLRRHGGDPRARGGTPAGDRARSSP